jgi:D-alanine-D-alanine ligase
VLETILKRIPDDLRGASVAVISGGPSPERDISIRSGQKMSRALEALGFKVSLLEYDAQLQRHLEASNIKLCCLATHGVPGEDGKLQGYLESMGCFYSGASVAGSALAMNKLSAKALLASEGILTPPWARIRRKDSIEDTVRHLSTEIGFPLVLKPTFGGSSIGVRLVHDRSECRMTLEDLMKDHHHLFAEKFIKGRECVVSYLEDLHSLPFALPIMEVEPKNLFYDYECKLASGKKDFIVPAILEPSIEKKCLEWGRRAHDGLLLRDMSRSDFILSENHELYYLETNSIPGMTDNSDLPAQAKAGGITFEELVLSMIMGPWRRMQASQS